MRNACLLGLLILTVSSCGDGPSPIEVPGTGWVGGVAYVDRDGDGTITDADGPIAGVLAGLVLESTGDTVARATSRADGSFALPNVPVGRYRLVANRGAAGDSVDVLNVDSELIDLAAGDSVTRRIRLGYPRMTIAAAKAAPAGRRITIEGIALNGWATFGDSVVHVADATGAIRALRVPLTNVQAGDSVSVMGTVGSSSGRVVLADARARVVVAARGLPPADSLNTVRVASADAGRLADGQARFAGGIVRDTGSVGAYRRIGVDDGSGRVEVLLHRGIAFPTQAYAAGATVSFTGVLTPSTSGTGWQLKPRTPSDVVALFPVVLAAQTRTLPIGTRVFVEGIALNGWATFGDSTVHVADRSGAVRAVRVLQSPVAAGDSVHLLGTIGLNDGRRALFDAVLTVVAAARGLPAVDVVPTAAVTTADNGARADGSVRIVNAQISDTLTVSGERILGVNDGSGRAEVALDPQIAFGPGPYVPGGTLSVTGVLVPAPGGSGWRLKPRSSNDVTLTFNVVTTVDARTLPLGQQVVLQGIALNATATFADSTVHVLDATGALRSVRTRGTVAAGDSIRLVGVLGTRDGQRVLTDASASVMRAGVGVPVADSVSTTIARTAQGGVRDANQVRIAGSIIGSQTLSNGDIVLTVDDGSGAALAAEVVLDRDLTFAAGPYVVGALLDVRGVLVPTGTGTWRVKPRGSADAQASYARVTVAQARGMPAGKVVQIRAIALNGWSDFGDASVHISDATGTMRVIALPSAMIFRGDSVLIHGSVETVNGQPMLRGLPVPPGPGPSVLLQGIGVPTPDSLSTGEARTASGGTRDAGQVRVRGRITTVANDGFDMLLTITDGSGDLLVRLKPSSRFPAGSFTVNSTVRVSGVLVPTAAGTWDLRPRSVDEIAIVGT